MENILRMKPYPLGAHCEADAVRFAFVSGKEKCGVILYDRTTGKELSRIPFIEEERIGNVYCKYVKDVDVSSVSYQFYEDGKIVADEYARGFAGEKKYGKQKEESSFFAVFPKQDFDWEHDKRPRLPYRDCICYCMHVRGFTRHASSGVKNKGTFAGVVEKLPYLKKSGFTTIELQPAYEFLEMGTKEEALKDRAMERINYWGYKKGFYYMPKAGYAAGEDACAEFKEMVKAFHKYEMEVVMQFYFPAQVNICEIPEILRYWVLEYHVDGFHLKGENLPVNLIAGDPFLADTKIWYDSFEGEEPLFGENLAVYRDDYKNTMRRFLKGDEDMLNGVIYQMRHVPENKGRIHYFSNYYGMTLADMVSYDYRHNEANGEDNRDGTAENFSWNCGEEGPTRKTKIRELRCKQMKNALCMLLFSQSTPLLFMGDEFANSQRGNNNPYCQDNAVTWLNWKDLEKNRELYDFWVELVTLRKEHPILRPKREFRVMDTLSFGYPDLSYHGQSAWKPRLEGYNRQIGMMFCGKYETRGEKEDDFFYLAINMHWEYRELALPKLPKELNWQLLYKTAKDSEMKANEKTSCCKVPPRSIFVFVSRKSEASVK